MPRISVFTPTRGEEKRPYLKQVLDTLRAQTMSDWEWWVLDNSDDMGLYHEFEKDAYDDVRQDKIQYVWDNDFDRSQVHAMPYLLNKYYPLANGDLVFYISDDDLLHPDTFQTFVDFFDAEPDKSVTYVSLGHAHVTSPTDSLVFRSAITTSGVRGAGQVDCQIDGGQIMHRKSCLDSLEKPWFPESADDASARHCDGQFMEKLAQHYPFYPTGHPTRLYVQHRFTPVSHFTPSPGKIGV